MVVAVFIPYKEKLLVCEPKDINNYAVVHSKACKSLAHLRPK